MPWMNVISFENWNDKLPLYYQYLPPKPSSFMTILGCKIVTVNVYAVLTQLFQAQLFNIKPGSALTAIKKKRKKNTQQTQSDMTCTCFKTLWPQQITHLIKRRHWPVAFLWVNRKPWTRAPRWHLFVSAYSPHHVREAATASVNDSVWEPQSLFWVK